MEEGTEQSSRSPSEGFLQDRPAGKDPKFRPERDAESP